MIALRPMRPIALRSPVPAMPTTSVEKSSGAMIILIIRRNTSAIGLMATPQVGHTRPMTMPRTSPMKIWVVRPGTNDREGEAAAAESVRRAMPESVVQDRHGGSVHPPR